MARVILHRPIFRVVVATIFPREQYEFAPEDMPLWVCEYGHLRHPETGEPATLVGVRLPAHEHIVSYASTYWYARADGTWKTWHFYIGVSGGAGLRIERD